MIINADTSNGNSKQIENINDINDINDITNTNCNFIIQTFNTLDVVENKINISLVNQLKSDYDEVKKYESRVCNRQFQLNVKQNSYQNNRSGTVKTETTSGSKDINETACAILIDDPPATNLSNVDEMSETGIHSVPRGIVNPNYPGFQHLAHTLQEYNSTSIDNNDNSENDMTDDDLDEPKQTTDCLYQHSKMNCNITNIEISNEESYLNERTQNVAPANQLPDLLKTISNNNNNNNDILISCTATDIENNFNTKDIIGDFNKEIEDEIRHLLNYNINIEDDLQELRNDIKDTFAKPIENTINNISEVVNDVIKKLIKNDVCDKHENLGPQETEPESVMEIETVMEAENETNARTELSISRPTFLLLESNTQTKITDAILSDGKEEINVCDYNAEHLSYNVENTLKQLSTELRKIIPKLNEIREREKLWTENKKEIPILTDGNSNNIVHCLNDGATSARLKFCDENILRRIPMSSTYNKKTVKNRNETRSRLSTTKIMSKVKTSSVHCYRDDYIKENEFDSFDVYNIETALPKLDFDTIENHIKAAKDAERRLISLNHRSSENRHLRSSKVSSLIRISEAYIIFN